MQLTYRTIFPCFLMLVAASWCAQANADVTISQADRQAFDRLYQQKIESVKKTRSLDDDRELAGEMLTVAGDVPDDPGLQCLIYTEVIPLAIVSGDGGAMKQAVTSLKKLMPNAEVVALPNLVRLAESAYKSARRADRGPIAEVYLDFLIETITSHEAEGEYRAAILACRQAEAVAKAVDSPKAAQIKLTHDDILDRYNLVKRIDQLKVSIERNPQNTFAARELIELLVIKMGDLKTASEYSKIAEDKEQEAVLAIAVAGMDKASATDAILVGDWYASMADGQNDSDAQSLLLRAREWYAHFFEVHQKRDALAVQVNAADKAVKLRLAQLSQADGWINLIKTDFDPNKHKLERGELVVRDGKILAKEAWFVLPVHPKGSYDLRIQMTVKSGDLDKPGVVVYFPMGNSGGTARYYFAGEEVVSIGNVNKALQVRGRKNMAGERAELMISVRPESANAGGIKLYFKGKPATSWQGSVAQLEQPVHVMPPASFGNAIGVLVGKTVVAEIHAIEMREVKDE